MKIFYIKLFFVIAFGLVALNINAAPQGAVLRPTPGLPVLVTPEGATLSPLIFAGSSLGLPDEIGSEWREISYSIRGVIDDSDAFVQINIGSQKGQLDIRDFTLKTESLTLLSTSFTAPGWERDWKIVDSKKIGVSTAISTNGLTISIPKRMEFPWDVQLCSRKTAIKCGTNYTVSFKLRAHASTPWPVTSYLMRMSPLRFYGSNGKDQFIATASHVVSGKNQIISPVINLPWPEKSADYEREVAVATDYFDQIMKKFPETKLLLRIGVEPPSWWVKANPEEMQRWENGKTANYVCVASEKWRQDVRTHLSRLIPLLEKHFGDRIAGYLPVAQSTGEWYYPIWNHADWGSMNHSTPFTKGYRAFLQQRYTSIAALNQAWGGAPRQDFTAINVPSGKARRVELLAPFRDPAKQRELLDFADYEQAAMREALENAARSIKTAAGNEKPIFAFYGYSFELPGCQEGIGASGHLQLGRLLQSPYIDGVVDITSYFDRGAKGTGALMTPVESITNHGKLLFTEDDSRTHLSAANAGYERTETSNETCWSQTRNLVRSLVHHGYTWKFDLYGGGWFNDAELWKELRKTEQAFNTIPPKPFRSDIAVIIDEKSFMALSPGIELTRPLVYDFRSVIGRSGLAEPSWWLLDDVVTGKVPPHRLTIFVNAFYLNAKEKKAIGDYCRQSGGTVLWMYAPGYLDERGEDFAGMQELTGFSFERFKLAPGVQRRAEFADQEMKIHGEVTLPDNLNDYFTVAPAKTQVIGKFAGGQVAMASSNAAGYTSIFCAPPKLTPAILAAIGKSAGAWNYIAPGNVLITDGKIMAITAQKDGKIDVDLPVTCRITTINGQTVDTAAKHFTVTLKTGETKVFILTEPSTK